VRFGRQQLDLQPPAEPRRIGPHGIHLGRRVAGDHDASQMR
jgi:hypothetical protein